VTNGPWTIFPRMSRYVMAGKGAGGGEEQPAPIAAHGSAAIPWSISTKTTASVTIA
jgi:hypothetical protein